MLELGCGSGFAGVCAGKAGGNVLFTDISPLAVQLAVRNGKRNAIRYHTQCYFLVLCDALPDINHFYVHSQHKRTKKDWVCSVSLTRTLYSLASYLSTSISIHLSHLPRRLLCLEFPIFLSLDLAIFLQSWMASSSLTRVFVALSHLPPPFDPHVAFHLFSPCRHLVIFCESNCEYQTHFVRCDGTIFNWENADEDATLDKAFDIVVATDCLYKEDNVMHLVALLPRLLQPNGTAFLADPGRGFVDDFVSATEQKTQLRCAEHSISNVLCRQYEQLTNSQHGTRPFTTLTHFYTSTDYSQRDQPTFDFKPEGARARCGKRMEG